MKPCDKMFGIDEVKKDDGRPLLLLSHFLKRWGGIIGTTAKRKINRQIIERRGVNEGKKVYRFDVYLLCPCETTSGFQKEIRLIVEL